MQPCQKKYEVLHMNNNIAWLGPLRGTSSPLFTTTTGTEISVVLGQFYDNFFW